MSGTAASPPSPASDSLLPPGGHAALAELAFGSLSCTALSHLRADGLSVGRHLALLPADALELDLADPQQRRLGDYELLELIGEGGMGVVYRARQLSLDREVAVKLLAAGPWASREFIERFRREAQNAARMQHPNIVTVFEVGTAEELHFFSMALVRGQSLAAKLRQGGPLTPRHAAVLMRTIAEALDYAHSLDVLHLDLKPANVLLDESGVPHVADFGLARRLDRAFALDNTEISGTPSYMAPEQASLRQQKLSAATDIWGLGAILYELVTGHPPFRGDDAPATLRLVLDGRVRAPRRSRPDLPRDLEAVILKCLARDPAERYASARALADDLSRFIEGRAVRARPLNTLQRIGRWALREPKLAATALLALGALLLGLAATMQQWRRAEFSAGAARDNLWATRAQTAQQALADGDGFRGLRPLVANLAEMEAAGRTDEARIERLRIGTILANAPQLLGLVRLPSGETVSSVAIAPDARHFSVATFGSYRNDKRHIHQYDMESMRETWSVSTENRTFLMAGGDSGMPHSGLHYSTDGRFLLASLIEQPVVPAPRYSDMVAIDTRDGRVLGPEGLAEPHADIVYDDTLRYALVRFRSDKSLRWPDAAQFYAVDGWRAIGPRHTVATTLAADLWLPPPDGGAWLGTRDGVHFALYDVPDLAPRWTLQLPQISIVRAWRFSHDGRWLALGSVDGTVRLVAAADGHAVDLASGPAARVLKLEFNADDRTLAAIDANGQLWNWDVATRASRAAPHDFLSAGSVGARIRFAGDTLFGGGLYNSRDSEFAYASLAPRAAFNNEAVPGAVRVHGDTAFGTAFDVSAPARRLVTANGDSNLVQAWRLPPAPLLAAHAAPLAPLVQTFDGTRLAAVDGDTVRAIDAATGAPLSPPLHHPEPVQFADFAPDRRVLATIAGGTVRVIDAANWQLRGAPIPLPQTPERAAFAQAAPLLVVTTAEYAGDVRRERLHLIDLAQGRLRSAAARVDAITDYAIDAQGRHAIVLAWNRSGQTGPMRIALDDAKVSCAPTPGEVWNYAFAADGRSAWFAVAGQNPQLTLRHWDLDACRELPVAEHTPMATTAVLMESGAGLIVHRGGKEALTRFGADGHKTAALGEAIADPMYAFALSADGERAAITARNAVHLLDAHGGRRLSAPLAAPIAGDDAIAKLAFSPDGARLVARTINGRWLYWELPRAESASAELTRLARVLDPDPDAPLADSEVEAFGKWLQATAAAPKSPSPPPQTPVVFAPAAGAGVDPRFVPIDLARAIDVPLVGRVWPEPLAGGDLPTLAPGRQRFLGIEYRVDGGVQLSGGGTALALHPEHRRSALVPVPDVRARRVHVLAFMHIPIDRKAPPRTFAHVVLIGTDGRETRLELRTLRDVLTHGSDPTRTAPGARIALVSTNSANVRRGMDATQPWSAVYSVALDVPPGTAPVRGLRFDVGDGPMEAPLFFAATLERARADTTGGKRP